MTIINNNKYAKYKNISSNNKHGNANGNNNNTSPNPNTLKKQGGFTLVELGLALIIILILGGVIYASFTALYNSTKDQAVETEILQFNLALHRCLDRDNASLSACNNDKIILYSGLTSTSTACGDTWSATPSANNVEFTYPLGRCEDSDGLGASLAQKINQLPKVSATYTTNNLVITGTR